MLASILFSRFTSAESSKIREFKAAGVFRSLGDGGGVLPNRVSNSLEDGKGKIVWKQESEGVVLKDIHV